MSLAFSGFPLLLAIEWEGAVTRLLGSLNEILYVKVQ